jgi:hypothetical protein
MSVEKFCVVCDYTTDNNKSVCDECSIIHNIPTDYVPTVCGDENCYLDFQGMPNFDGECGHSEIFDSMLKF